MEKVAFDTVRTATSREMDAAVDGLVRTDRGTLLYPSCLRLERDVGFGVARVPGNVAAGLAFGLLSFRSLLFDAGVVLVPDVEVSPAESGRAVKASRMALNLACVTCLRAGRGR